MFNLKFDLSKLKVNVKLVSDLLLLTGASLSVYYLLNAIINEYLDKSIKNKESDKKGKGILKKIQNSNPHLKNISLNQYENCLLYTSPSPRD